MAEDVFGIIGSLQAAVFRVERVVAEGGFAVVYRAHHEGFQAAVALKCLKIPGNFTAEQSQAFLQKFREEGELLFRLSSLIPSVVRPLQVGALETPQSPFVPFIALEWLDGDSLEATIERRRRAGKAPFELARVARMMGPVARGLECAHQFPGPDGARFSILHRDLKPENLLLAQLHGQQALRILDFGIGKVRSAATQLAGRMTAEQSDLLAFTPAYGAPEQWLPKRYGQTGPWTDVWGFALCAVAALIGKTPFEGDAQAVMGACMDERERPTPRSFGVQLPERAEAAFRKALAVDPQQRFHDIGEFWDEIEAAAGVTTPRIDTSGGFLQDSVLPPPELVELEQGTATELDITQRASGATRFPSLTLGFEPPALAQQAAAARPPVPRRGAPPVPPRGAPPIPRRAPEPSEPAPHLSLMPNNSLEQLQTAELPRPAARAKSPELAVRNPIARAPRVRHLPSEAPTMATVFARLVPALRLFAAAVAIMIADVAFTTSNGHPFTLGPVRALWIAGPLVGWGAVKLVLALVG